MSKDKEIVRKMIETQKHQQSFEALGLSDRFRSYDDPHQSDFEFI